MRGGNKYLKNKDLTEQFIRNNEASIYFKDSIKKIKNLTYDSKKRERLNELKTTVQKNINQNTPYYYPVYRLDKSEGGFKKAYYYKVTMNDDILKLESDTLDIPVKECSWKTACKVNQAGAYDNEVVTVDIAKQMIEKHGVYDSFPAMLDVFINNIHMVIPDPPEPIKEEKKEVKENPSSLSEEDIAKINEIKAQNAEAAKKLREQMAKDQAENNPYNKYKDMTDDDIKNEYTQKKAKLNTSSEAIADKKKAAIAIRDLADTFNKEIVKAFNKSDDLKEFFRKESNEYVEKAGTTAKGEKDWLER
tara:strand:- start:729 stop:1643 length:915 start_codon:yes stop_codon:yes gene_type:complete